MKYIEFDVNGLALFRNKTDKTQIISGTMNYYGIQINFNEEWAAMPGLKAIELFKSRNRIRIELVDNKCRMPNCIVADKNPFDIRVICGDSIATPWVPVGVTEGGTIYPEEPDEENPDITGYVKSPIGNENVAMLRQGKSGLEYSQNGSDWTPGISGVPDVPDNGKVYSRSFGDWVEIPEGVEIPDDSIEEAKLAANVKSKLLKGQGTAIADLTETPAKEDFNLLLSQLRAAGVIAE